MTTKDQLDQLFRAEIERMTAHLDDIAFAVRRSGAVDDVREMEADIEVGWAYRLIQLFGTTRLLTFEADCGGRGLLLRHGIPEPHIAPIAETFRGEQKQARSSVFDRDVRQQMADVGLADTLANRERAKMELYRAKADALLNVAERWPMIDRRQNALVATTLPEEERVALELVPAPEAAPELLPSASTQRETIVEPISLGSSPDVAVNRVERSADPAVPQKAPVALPAEIIPAELSDRQAVAPTGRVLFLTDFENACDDLCKNNKENWAPDTASDVRVLGRVFRHLLKEHGVAHSGEIGQEHVAVLRQHLNHIPKRYGQSARQRAMKPAALRAFAAEEVARAERLGIGRPSVGLSAARRRNATTLSWT